MNDDSLNAEVPIPNYKPEDWIWADTDKLVEATDPNYYAKMYDVKYGEQICDGKGPWSCEGYIGCPCDCT